MASSFGSRRLRSDIVGLADLQRFIDSQFPEEEIPDLSTLDPALIQSLQDITGRQTRKNVQGIREFAGSRGNLRSGATDRRIAGEFRKGGESFQSLLAQLAAPGVNLRAQARLGRSQAKFQGVQRAREEVGRTIGEGIKLGF
jgi:hypothetical protein